MAVTRPPDKSTFINALQEIGKPRATDTELTDDSCMDSARLDSQSTRRVYTHTNSTTAFTYALNRCVDNWQ